jgi:hypothetical protein
LASNEALIGEMLQSAQTTEGTLNVLAFSQGLTHGVELYDIGNETRQSTNYDDVFLTKNHRDSWIENDDEEGPGVQRDLAEERKSLSQSLKRKFTAPAIDMVVGTFRSKTLMVLSWVMYVACSTCMDEGTTQCWDTNTNALISLSALLSCTLVTRDIRLWKVQKLVLMVIESIITASHGRNSHEPWVARLGRACWNGSSRLSLSGEKSIQ